MQCKERARVEMGRGEDQTEEEQINNLDTGVAIATAETLTPVWHDIRENTSGKGTRQVAGQVRT